MLDSGLFFDRDAPPFGRWCAIPVQGPPCEFRAWAASRIRLAAQGTPRRPLPYPAGGRPQPPKSVGIVEWDSLDDGVAFYKSKAWTDLAPQRDKAVKVIRRFVVEVEK